MKINRNNYEIYFLDYFDGRLDEASIRDLEIFLFDHPDLEEEFNNYKHQFLPLDTPLFVNKELLKRDFKDFNLIEENNFEEFCIAASEGDLDHGTLKKFNEYLRLHPKKRKEYEIIDKLKLIPGDLIVFPKKYILKKNQKIQFKRVVLFTISTAAAVLLILFFNLRNRNSENLLVQGESIDSYSYIRENVPQEFFVKKPIKTEEKKRIVIPQKKKENIDNTNYSNPAEIAERQNLMPRLDPIGAELESNLNDELNKSLRGQSFIATEIKFETRPANQYDRLNLLSLAEAGIKGVNYLTESEIKFQKKVDDKGEITEFGIELQRFGFSTQRKK